MIRAAKQSDIAAVEKSYIELLEHEQNSGTFSNWKLGVYPTRQTAQNALEKGWLFVLEENGDICASMIVNTVQPCEHEKIAWKYKVDDDKAVTVHTLCVPPSKAGHGYGRMMMQYALDFAKKAGYEAVRLDTYAGNLPAQSLYKKLGFSSPGTAHVTLEGLITEELMYFEYLL